MVEIVIHTNFECMCNSVEAHCLCYTTRVIPLEQIQM